MSMNSQLLVRDVMGSALLSHWHWHFCNTLHPLIRVRLVPEMGRTIVRLSMALLLIGRYGSR
jgi:hypothetical protein